MNYVFIKINKVKVFMIMIHRIKNYFGIKIKSHKKFFKFMKEHKKLKIKIRC